MIQNHIYIWSLSINFRYFGRKTQRQQKLATNITHFTKHFCFKNITHFTTLNSVNSPLQHSQKLTHFTNFLAKIFLVGVKKKHFHCTIPRRPRTAFSKHLESKCLYILVDLRKKLLFQKM